MKDAPAPKYYEESLIANDHASLIEGPKPILPSNNNRPAPAPAPASAPDNNLNTYNNNHNIRRSSGALKVPPSTIGNTNYEPSKLVAGSDQPPAQAMKKPPPSGPADFNRTDSSGNRRTSTNLTEENEQRARHSAARRRSSHDNKAGPATGMHQSPPSSPTKGGRKSFPDEKFPGSPNSPGNKKANMSAEPRNRPAGLSGSNKKRPPSGGAAYTPGAVAITNQQLDNQNSNNDLNLGPPLTTSNSRGSNNNTDSSGRDEPDRLGAMPNFNSANNNTSSRPTTITANGRSTASISTITPDRQVFRPPVRPAANTGAATADVEAGRHASNNNMNNPYDPLAHRDIIDDPVDPAASANKDRDAWSEPEAPTTIRPRMSDKRYYLLSGMFCLLIVGAIAAVVVVVIVGKSSGSNDTPAAAAPPGTETPMMAPTDSPIDTVTTEGQNDTVGANVTGLDDDLSMPEELFLTEVPSMGDATNFSSMELDAVLEETASPTLESTTGSTAGVLPLTVTQAPTTAGTVAVTLEPTTATVATETPTFATASPTISPVAITDAPSAAAATTPEPTPAPTEGGGGGGIGIPIPPTGGSTPAPTEGGGGGGIGIPIPSTGGSTPAPTEGGGGGGIGIPIPSTGSSTPAPTEGSGGGGGIGIPIPSSSTPAPAGNSTALSNSTTPAPTQGSGGTGIGIGIPIPSTPAPTEGGGGNIGIPIPPT